MDRLQKKSSRPTLPPLALWAVLALGIVLTVIGGFLTAKGLGMDSAFPSLGVLSIGLGLFLLYLSAAGLGLKPGALFILVGALVASGIGGWIAWHHLANSTGSAPTGWLGLLLFLGGLITATLTSFRRKWSFLPPSSLKALLGLLAFLAVALCAIEWLVLSDKSQQGFFAGEADSAKNQTLGWERENQRFRKNNEVRNLNNGEQSGWSGEDWMIRTQTHPAEPDERGKDRTHRILVMGDSYVWGDGYANFNDFWWRQLQVELEERGYHSVEVLGMGACGASTDHQLDEVDAAVGRYKPDLIVWGFISNDPDEALLPDHDTSDNPVIGVADRTLRSLSHLSANGILPRTLRFFSGARTKKIKNGRNWITNEQWLRDIIDPEQRNWPAYEKTIEDLGVWTKNNGLPSFLVLLNSYPNTLRGPNDPVLWEPPLHKPESPLTKEQVEILRWGTHEEGVLFALLLEQGLSLDEISTIRWEDTEADWEAEITDDSYGSFYYRDSAGQKHRRNMAEAVYRHTAANRARMLKKGQALEGPLLAPELLTESVLAKLADERVNEARKQKKYREVPELKNFSSEIARDAYVARAFETTDPGYLAGFRTAQVARANGLKFHLQETQLLINQLDRNASPSFTVDLWTNPANGHSSSVLTKLWAEGVADILERDHVELLGERSTEPFIPRQIVNDWLPADMIIESSTRSRVFEIILAPSETRGDFSSKRTPDAPERSIEESLDLWPVLPVGEPHLRLHLNHPSDIDRIKLEGLWLNDAEVYVTSKPDCLPEDMARYLEGQRLVKLDRDPEKKLTFLLGDYAEKDRIDAVYIVPNFEFSVAQVAKNPLPEHRNLRIQATLYRPKPEAAEAPESSPKP